MIEGVEITIYSTTGENIAFDLSPAQLAIVVKILGLQLEPGQEIRCFSDSALKRIAEMKSNPLHLQIVES